MTREDQRKHQEALELARATKAFGEAVVASKREPRHRFLITTMLTVTAFLVAAFVALYVARPSVEPVDAFLRCPICDRGGPFPPPQDVLSANTGAVFSVKLQNTGGMGTTLISQNLSFSSLFPGESPSQLSSQEVAGPDDDTPVTVGPHSTVTLSIPRGEVLAVTMRKLVPAPDTPNFLFGHYTYSMPFWFSTTKRFCFRYIPPAKGLPETWVVCRTEPAR